MTRIASIDDEMLKEFERYGPYGFCNAIKTSDGFEFWRGPYSISYRPATNSFTCRKSIPDGFPENRSDYNSKGMAYTLSDDLGLIIEYNLNTGVRSERPVAWATVGGMPFVTFNRYIDESGSSCTVSGHTRNATKMTYVIDMETGLVSETEVAEYSGSVVHC